MSHSPSPRLSGSLLNGRFVIQRRRGSGSMGTVYLARDTRERRVVALKVIRADRPRATTLESFYALRSPPEAAAIRRCHPLRLLDKPAGSG